MTTAPAHVQVRLPPQSRSRTAVGGRPRPWWLVPVGAYVVSRLLVGLGVLFAYVAYPSRAPSYFLHRWDSAWYLAIARHGYPAHLNYPVGLHGAPPRYSPWAFFPLFPLLVRAVHEVTALGYTISAYALNVVIAGLAVLVLWRLARAVAGSEAADRTVLLFCAFPGSVVLSLAYSEALFILLVTLTLLLLVRHRWWLAGLTGALCSLTRPTGVRSWSRPRWPRSWRSSGGGTGRRCRRRCSAGWAPRPSWPSPGGARGARSSGGRPSCCGTRASTSAWAQPGWSSARPTRAGRLAPRSCCSC
ncbi:MAG: mannosyltransferase family protein [Actinomycetes bacterium]